MRSLKSFMSSIFYFFSRNKKHGLNLSSVSRGAESDLDGSAEPVWSAPGVQRTFGSSWNKRMMTSMASASSQPRQYF